MFERVELLANDNKTQFMVIRGAKTPTALNSIAYENIRNGNWKKVGKETYEMRKRRTVEYNISSKQIRELFL